MVEYKELVKENINECLEFWASTPGVHLHDNGEDSPQGIGMYIDRNPGFSFVAEDNGKIIGAVLCGHDGRRGFVNHLAVATQYRRKGIASSLIRLSLEQLQKAGITKCALFVLNDNESGQSFYKNIGWQEETIVKTFSTIIK